MKTQRTTKDRVALTRALQIVSTLALWIPTATFWIGPVATYGQVTTERAIQFVPTGKPKMKYAIALHGGAGSSPQEFSEEANKKRYASFERALKMGLEKLEQGSSAMDVVELVVKYLEDDPQFNAGVGSVFNSAGSHELDAAIMDGRTKDCGAVAGVSRVKNPILAARAVMTKSPHVLLAGLGAEAFAKENGLEMVEPTHFDTPAARAAWERRRLQQPPKEQSRIFKASPEDVGAYIGTVGCVALDQSGNLAAATSTGGMSNKKYGRVGDTPIVGAGTYADNETCAVSCTGTGEQYIRHSVAYDLAARIKYKNQDIRAAAREILDKVLEPDDGGLIAVSKDGVIAYDYNTTAMGGAEGNSEGLFVIHWGDEQKHKAQMQGK